MILKPLSAVLLAAAAPVMGQSAPVAAAGAQAVEGARLKALFAASDEANLKRNPVAALFRGDLRYADRLGEVLTDAKTVAERGARAADLAALARIDRAKLSPVDRIAYDVFRQEKTVELKGLAPQYDRIERLLPIDHFSGFQIFYPDLASGSGAAPFKTVADYDNNLKRNAQYAVILDRALARFREGMAAGIVYPRLVVENMIAQFDKLAPQNAADSVFYGPVKTFPDAVPAADRARLTAAYTAQIRDVLNPAHRRMRDFLKAEYLPRARTTVGLSALPGGAALYDYRIEANTSLQPTADAVHRLGLGEVARILKEMEAQKAAAGFKGTLAEFFTHLRTDPKFQPKTAQEIRDGYAAIGKRVDARVREQFSLIPKTPLEIRPVPDFKAPNAAAGSYDSGAPDGSRPGVFNYNTYDLKNRYLWDMETLYLHEAVPGHHFQVSLAQENEALPAFIRFGGNTAYVEGWALYAETLYRELGVESDPYQRMGGLNDEMLRAMRLVVDTGLHTKGWGRDQAVRYMTDNSPMPFSDAAIEVERYIAMPGQALAYKIGQLTFLRLKAKAKAELGARFDPREFHAQALDTGALPMTVLERKIDDWIATRRGG